MRYFSAGSGQTTASGLMDIIARSHTLIFRVIFSDEPGVTVEQAKVICGMRPERIALTKASNEVMAEVVKYLESHEQVKVRGNTDEKN